MAEDVLNVAEAFEAPPREALVAVAIVGGALVRVAQDRVGLGRFLEPLLGVRVVGVAIRMQIEGEATVRLLDLDLGGRFLDPEDFVVVALGHREPPKDKASMGSVKGDDT